MRKLQAAAALGLGASLLSAATTGCSSFTGGEADPCQTANMDPAIPIDTARDWVTYADHMVIVRWVSERAQAHPGRGRPSAGRDHEVSDRPSG